jgi:NAD(P)H dehydrogenase (quinone)
MTDPSYLSNLDANPGSPTARRALVILAHPCADSLGAALAAAAVQGLRRGGAHVDLLDLYDNNFQPVMSLQERRSYLSDSPISDPVVAEHARLVAAADTLVFVYPTWWSGLPAILKGWLERVLVSGVAFHIHPTTKKIQPGLQAIQQIIGVSTYGSPRPYVAAINDNGRRILTRSLRLAAGFRTRTKWLGLYAVDTATAVEREAFVDSVRTQLERAVR